MRKLDELFDNDGKALLVVFVGKSYRGKSYFLKYLLSDRLQSGKLKFGLVFTSTRFNDDFTSFLPSNRVIEGYDEETLKKYFDNLKKIKKNLKNGKEMQPNFIVFDDLSGILENDTPFFQNFITTCRHLGTSVFIAVQYLSGKRAISTTMRQQTTHAIMFHSKMKNTTENLYNSYGQMFDTYKEFKNHYDEVTTGDYKAMLYIENEDDKDKNYIAIRAPSPDKLNNSHVKFKF